MRQYFVRLPAMLALALAAVVLPVARPVPKPHARVWALPVTRGVIELPEPASLIAVTWPRGARAPSAASVSTSRDGRSWTSWFGLDVEATEGPDRQSREFGVRGTSPLWVGRAVAVRVRLSPSIPRGARLFAVDPGRDPVLPARSALAAPASPEITTRAEWGADESLRRVGPRYAPSVAMAFVHHTASGNAYGPQDSARVVRSIYAYHVQGRGWDDIGYNFLVDRFGRIFEGRYGGADRAVIGAHAQGFNTRATGVAVIGTFGSSDPPPAAMAALRDILAWKLDLAFVDPLGKTTMRSGGSPKYADGLEVTLPAISGHRDTGETDCPGGRLYSRLPALREAVAATGDPKVYAPRIVRPAFTPNADGIADDTEIRLRFSSPVSWAADITDAAAGVVRRYSGTGDAASVTWDGKNAAGVVEPHGTYSVRVQATNHNGGTRPVALPVDLWAWPDGTALQGTHAGSVWMLQSGKLRHVAGWNALVSRMPPGESIRVPDWVSALYPAGGDAGFRDGTVVGNGGRLWVISDGAKRAAEWPALAAMGYDPHSLVDASPGELAAHPDGPPVVAGSYPDGAALRGVAMPDAWKLAGAGRPLVSDAIRASLGIRDVDLVGPADAAIASSLPLTPAGFRDGSLIATAEGRVWVISNGARRWITTPERFAAYGYRTENVRLVSEYEAGLQPEGAPL